MNSQRLCYPSLAALAAAWCAHAAELTSGESPTDHLPAHISQVTWFGERADWSHDGKSRNKVLLPNRTNG